MKSVLMIDPAISAVNIGDEIISESIRKHISPILKDSFVINISSHLPLSWNYKTAIGNCDYKFVCGSNLLMGRLNGRFKQWHIGYQDIPFLRGAILVGAGWWQYNNSPNLYTRVLYRNILSKEYVHSVRDNYTAHMLTRMGMHNVINTGCATMWDLTPEHCSKIPLRKSRSVVFTLTDYKKNPKKDKQIIDVLTQKYSSVFFWPQGTGDFAYLNSLTATDGITIIQPNLKSYDEVLKRDDIDYVGTRLHGGIRALQNKRRTIIVAIDNRANEKKKDFNLVCVDRDNIEDLKDRIDRSWETNIVLPLDNINKWKKQFENA